MAVVRSAGVVADVQRPWYPSSTSNSGSVGFYEGFHQDYAAIWRTQPNVRTVVGFLARNVAQLGLHIFERADDNDRRRITDGPAGRWLRRPTPASKVSLYDLLNWFVHDLCVFDNAYWLKVRADTNGAVATVPLLPQAMEERGGGFLEPETYRYTGPRGWQDFAPDQVVHVHGYNPTDRRRGVSPMETLRRILAEDLAAGRYREKFWLNSTRIEGVLQRPENRQPLSDIARARLKADWQAAYAGSEAGGTPLLEEGMTFTPTSWSAKDAEYIAARKLSREEVAAAFWVHPAMVGIMEHANFANMREQHRSTYQDTLGPILRQLEQAFALQLADDLGLPETAYFEFNIKDKLSGSFEEEARSLQAAVGAPHMTRNEARARQNLPAVAGGDELVTPLNVLIGGQASALDTGSQNVRSRAAKASAAVDDEHVAIHEQTLLRFFRRQQAAILAAVGATAKAARTAGTKASLAEVFDRERWDTELAADLLAAALATAQAAGDRVVELFDVEWDVTEVEGLFDALDESSRSMATEINTWTAEHLTAALDDDDPVAGARELFGGLIGTRAAIYAASRANTVWNFGRGVAARTAGVTHKTWRTNSGNPRSTHARLDGETVAIGETFSNGALWPGDPALPIEERAGCECSFDLVREAS